MEFFELCGKTVLILVVLFAFYHFWTRYQRKADLMRNLTAVLHELKSEEYEIALEEAGDHKTLELRNPTARITYSHNGSHEKLTCNCFFAHKEASGANVTIISRRHGDVRRPKVIYFLRKNELMGKMLYHQIGRTRAKEMHELFDEIRSQIAIYWAGKIFRDKRDLATEPDPKP